MSKIASCTLRALVLFSRQQRELHRKLSLPIHRVLQGRGSNNDHFPTKIPGISSWLKIEVTQDHGKNDFHLQLREFEPTVTKKSVTSPSTVGVVQETYMQDLVPPMKVIRFEYTPGTFASVTETGRS